MTGESVRVYPIKETALYPMGRADGVERKNDLIEKALVEIASQTGVHLLKVAL